MGGAGGILALVTPENRYYRVPLAIATVATAAGFIAVLVFAEQLAGWVAGR